MFYLPHTFTAQDWRRMLRAMAALALVWMVLGATSSYAQSCTNKTVTTIATPPPNVLFKNGASAKGTRQLANLAATVNFTGCSGFSNTTITFGTVFTSQFKAGQSNINGSTPTSLSLNTSMAISCFFNSCLNSTGGLIASSSPDKTDGIMFNANMQVTGLNASNTSCLSNPKIGSVITASTGRASNGSVVANSCTSFRVELKATFDQNNFFFPFTVATILPTTVFSGTNGNFGISTGPGSIISGNPLDTNLQGFKLFDAPTFRVLTGTCSLTLPSSAIDFQDISPDKLNASTNGTVVASQNFTLAINNCLGNSAGTKKALKWTFTTPKASDLTRMENASPGGATGMSAQIQADSKISPLDGSALPSVVTSDETYIASGNTSDIQTLTYKANLIRNADTVTTGSFSSTATVTLFYQ